MNKLFKYFIMTNMLTMLFSFSSRGQQAAGTPDQRRINKIAADFGITAQEATRLKLVLDYNRTHIDTLLKDKTLTTEERRARISVLLKERQTKVNEILTPEQQQKLSLLQRGDKEKAEIAADKLAQKNKDQLQHHLRGGHLKDTSSVRSGRVVNKKDSTAAKGVQPAKMGHGQ